MTNLLLGNLSKDYRTKLTESGEGLLDPGPDPDPPNRGTAGGRGAESLRLDTQDATKNSTKQIPKGPTTENPTSGEGTQAQREKEKDPTAGYIEGPRPGYDDYGQEFGKDPRFWKAYVQESKVWDADMVDGWNK
ncbi:hypothetical protein FRC06_001573 [Ceratobasidium sp. 370]|nr:hypothetical protein FRC06_001573 [Ceratobasidium sp. 370]